jgi:hypothetical protein
MEFGGGQKMYWPNKALVLTAPALSNFGIIARHNGFGGNVGVFLPHTARERRHNAGVRTCTYNESLVVKVVNMQIFYRQYRKEIFALLISGSGLGFSPIPDFWCGYGTQSPAFLPFALLALLFLYLCAGGIVLNSLIFHRKNKANMAIRIVFAVVLAMTGHAVFVSSSPIETFLWGFHSYLRHHLNSSVVQSWAVHQLEITPEFVWHTTRDDFPPVLKSLSRPPRDIFIRPNDEPLIRIFWGGHFIGYYGIEVGTQEHVRTEGWSGRFLVRSWAPGVYVCWQDEDATAY